MADAGSGEKTEEPTAKKIADARKKGQIARSKDLGTMFVLVGSAVAIMLVGGMLTESLAGIMKRSFSLSREEVMDIHALYNVLRGSVGSLVAPMLWIFSIIIVAAFIGNTMLGGMSFSAEAMAPKASKLSPLAGLKRMFGIKALVELFKSLMKFFVVFIVAYLLLSSLFPEILGLSLELIPLSLEHSVTLLQWMFLALALSVGIIAAIDAPYQTWDHNRQLKMTKQEIKDEMKNSEGSPEIKSRIRRTQYEMSQRKMMQEVPDSDVVITNPTHYAVALKYDVTAGGAPMLVAKGIDEMAMHIRTIAKENNVEIIASPALARSLYYSADANQEIPEELFAAVAQVLAFIFQLNEHKKGKAKRPKPIAKNLPIPDEFKY
ncbi:MAG: flagellar biosynthetic protein FlhB [Colwellia sp.]|jgi:flagellar biosynthetic protein FlhB|uniref:flagellar biosynthesis protein FlhB n=1 Tax=unclassified Colwellia TaxID=196834 RepID=UPI0015F672F0|nr:MULTISPECIES: flagellar biosynthesis protein FlhB [unclassified Colwellia]MBA6253818.1 flagellar biosynthesis protein FlhB [Colwellia sp. MB3u-55]MBA6396471.1 flagellar biosynthesis protein FlhB [Colwellia sp. BRX10-4]